MKSLSKTPNGEQEALREDGEQLGQSNSGATETGGTGATAQGWKVGSCMEYSPL